MVAEKIWDKNYYQKIDNHTIDLVNPRGKKHSFPAFFAGVVVGLISASAGCGG